MRTAVTFVLLLLCLNACGQYRPVSGGELVRHRYYELSYNEEHEQANWVYYKVSTGTAGRTDNFRPDPDVTTGSATPEDYRGSGFDRGHLCPAASMSIDATAMSESFLMSNMSPQYPAFNRGIWKSLETAARTFASSCETHIVTGPVFKDCRGNIGVNKVTVPGYYYKVVFQPQTVRMAAFVLPNEQSPANLDLLEYAVPVDKVEELTGIDFFSQIEDGAEDFLECRVNTNTVMAMLGRGTPETVSPVLPLPAEAAAGGNGVPTTVDSGNAAALRAPTESGQTYWLTASSRKRHNPGCRYHKNTRGRPCSKDEGIPCKICGG